MSTTTETAPESCPFCGAKGGGLYAGVARQYECGSWDWPKVPENGHPRESQSAKCATAERERLTRERDDWKRVAEELNAFMERARSKTQHSRESLYCLRQFDALKAKEAKP